MTEAEFLSAQATQAKAGMSRALTLGKQHAKQAANPKNIAKAQPFAAVGAAAVAGMAAAWIMVPSKANKVEKTAEASEPTGRRRRPVRSWRKSLLRMGLNYAKPMIISTITGAMSGKKAGEAAADDAVDEAATSAAHTGPAEHVHPGHPDPL